MCCKQLLGATPPTLYLGLAPSGNKNNTWYLLTASMGSGESFLTASPWLLSTAQHTLLDMQYRIQRSPQGSVGHPQCLNLYLYTTPHTEMYSYTQKPHTYILYTQQPAHGEQLTASMGSGASFLKASCRWLSASCVMSPSDMRPR